jgi:hypothetical protein
VRDGERIDERVREAHLDHYCPGGAGLPVTSSRPVGLGLEDATPGRAEWDDNAARAAGRTCGRCGRPIAPAQEARRRVSGTWVHENCPRADHPGALQAAPADRPAG